MNSMGVRYFFGFPIIGFILVALSQLAAGQGGAPSRAPIAPSNDGTTIDQGIAYVLLLIALAITYFVH